MRNLSALAMTHRCVLLQLYAITFTGVLFPAGDANQSCSALREG